MLIQPKESQQPAYKNKPRELHDVLQKQNSDKAKIINLIRAADENISNTKKELAYGYTPEKEKRFVNIAQNIYAQLHKMNVGYYISKNAFNKRENLTLWANDILASRGYRIFDAITSNWKKVRA